MKNRKLTQLWSFRTALGIPVAASMVASGMVLLSVPLTFDPTHTGLECFWELFNIPIKLLSSAIPLVGLVALNHRSIQTARQIELSQEQNIFTNYYKHREEFIKYAEANFPKESIKPIYAHQFLFPYIKEGVRKPISPLDMDLYEKLIQVALKYCDFIEKGEMHLANEMKFVDLVNDIKEQLDTNGKGHSLIVIKKVVIKDQHMISEKAVGTIASFMDQLRYMSTFVEFEDSGIASRYSQLAWVLHAYLRTTDNSDSGVQREELIKPLTELIKHLRSVEQAEKQHFVLEKI
ncbi:hypothetical protein [Vibrio sp. 10N.261.55.A7]|uniref:hypothetical protein n=1 Tax=Vibrio sp. 10N.261.55.A7 TaxID=1880851 RepID=UPI000C814B05|nr:hypothetical protein [Vibrio sp. 10N.261.55.A7]PMJ99538.1 hypothetical protein BCU12_03625 [Vibrio sp. 10N.261.55.A7]